MVPRRLAKAMVLSAAGVAVLALFGGAPAGANALAPGWTALGAPYAPTEGVHEVGTAISCPTATSCAAVGYFEDTSDTQQALLMDGSGSEWTPSEATLPSGASTTAPDASLVSVSCYSAGNCVAAGGYTNPEPRLIPMLVSETDGTWGAAFDAPPLPDNPYVSATVVKISCSAQVCAAVGQAVTTMSPKGYIVVGFGDSWTSLLAPLPADAASRPHAELTDVSCTESTCEAVGDYIDGSGDTRGVILTYDGATWTASEAPLPAAAAASRQHAKVEVISCPAAGECAAAGNFTDSAGRQQALLLTETSGHWSAEKGKLPTGTPANPHPEFEALDCSQAGDCAAVGFDDADGRHNQVLPLAVAESGGVWQPAVNPHLPANAISLSTNQEQSALDTVSCPTASYCEAGGFYTRVDESNPALVVGLRTSGWSAGMETPLPTNANPGIQAARFFGLSCAGTSACEGVGWYKGPFGQMDHALILGSGTPPIGVAQAARARVLAHHVTARVRISCSGRTDCAVSLILAIGSSKVALGQTSATAKARQSIVVPITLNAQGVRLFKGKRALPLFLLSVSERESLVSAQKLRLHR